MNLQQWLALLEARHPKEIDLGLDRSQAVWTRMGSPSPARSLFIVGGTNGKGSTVAYICALLAAMGHSYGSYTSPHLLRYNERIRIRDEAVNDRDLLASFEAVENARVDTSLSYFEFGTLAAIDLMARKSLDYAVLEVGLGGRLDAVNILDGDCVVITPVGLDHQDYLGDDLESIGREKAGIIRGGRPLVCGQACPPDSIVSRSRELGAKLLRLGVEFSVRSEGDYLHYSCAEGELRLPLPQMQGAHQACNLATAVTAVNELVPAILKSPDKWRAALKNVRLSGRLQQVRDRPRVLVDVGHNPLAAQVVARTLETMRAKKEFTQIRCVIGMLGDKNAEAVALSLEPLVSDWYCAGLTGSRAQSGRKLSQRIRNSVEQARTRDFSTVGKALACAISDARETDCILVFGSFQTAAEAIRSL